MARQLIVTTGSSVEGFLVQEYLGIVRGISVRAPTIGQGLEALGSALSGDWQAGVRMREEICEAARDTAYTRMIEHAHDLGADAILAMRYDACEAGEHASEVLAYGTAVKLRIPDALPG